MWLPDTLAVKQLQGVPGEFSLAATVALMPTNNIRSLADLLYDPVLEFHKHTIHKLNEN